MSGWFAVKRGISEHPIFKGRMDRLGFFIWMIESACWKDTKFDINGKTVTLERGQFCASYHQMSRSTGVPVKVIRNLLGRLEGGSVVGIATGKGRTIITICNYDKYQASQTVEGKAKGKRGASEGQAKEQGNNITKERKKDSLSERSDVKADLASAVSLFKEAAKRQGWPTIRGALSKARMAALMARLRDDGGLEAWSNVLAKASASNHCNGGNDRGWQVSLDFLISKSGFDRTIEGNFDNKKPNLTAINGGNGNGQSPSKGEDRMRAFIGGARGSS